MKNFKKSLILPAVATVMFLVTLIVLTQNQASYSAAVPGIVETAKVAAPIKTGYQMAFDLGTTNYYGIIPASAIVATILVGLALIPSLKKYSSLLVISAATLALCSFGIYLSNLGSSNYLVSSINKSLGAASGVAKFKVTGTWAYFVGIFSQVVAGCSLICYAIISVKEEK